MQQEALNKTFQKLEELDLPLITVTYFVADEKKTGGVCVKYFFNDNEKVTDAADSTKTSIYDFIQKNVSTAIVVDCENSDVYKLFAMLKNLNQEELSKIKKIILYDDYHTTTGWDWLEKFTSIPVEHIEVERVVDNKFLRFSS